MSCPPNRIVEGSAFFAYNAALFAISLFVCLSFPLIFKYYKKFHRYPRLVARKTIFIYLFAIPFICFVFAEIFVEIVNYSCGLQAFLYLMIIPLILGAQICRNLRLLFLTKFYEVSRIYGKITLEEQDELIHFKYSFRDMVREIVTVFQEAGNTNQNLNPKQKVSSIFYLKKLSSPLGILGTLLIITTPTTIFALVFALARPGYTACVGCRRDLVITLIIIGEMIVGFGFALFVAFRIRHLPDPFGLITEGRLLLVFLGITVLTLPIDVAVYDGNNPNHEFMRYIFNGIYCVALWCAFFCGSILQVYLSYRSHRAENGYRSMVQSSNNAASVGGKATSQGAESESRDEYKEYADIKGCAPILCKILTNELIASDFEALLTKEYAIENLFFLKDTYDWMANFATIAQSARDSRARRIMKSYLKHDAVYAVNLPSEMFNVLIGKINEGNVGPDLFAESRKEIAQLLNKGQARRFWTAKKMLDEKASLNKPSPKLGKGGKHDESIVLAVGGI